jgi:putative glutamine amidotransferase
MARPVIGITARRWLHAAEADRRQAVTVGLDARYVEAVAAAGGAPVLLPRTRDAGAAAATMDRVDGLLLPGGGDIVSLAFREEPHPANRYQDPALDDLEAGAARAALERGLPILGICRGIQVLNVLLGGTLVQDIPSQVPDAVLHWTRARDVVQVHTVRIEPGTQLAVLWGEDDLPVNSYHHQAVGELGRGLRVNCRSSDGVIEGVEAADGRPILAVQCHPEEDAATYPPSAALFRWLVEAASGG